jgi:hypothetical protein
MTNMKNLIKINFLLIATITFCGSVHAQKRASDKSFTTVLNEVKQQQAMRSKMLQQRRQSIPVDNGAQSNVSIQPTSSSANLVPTNQSTATTGAARQMTNDKPLTKPVKQPAISGKQ